MKIVNAQQEPKVYFGLHFAPGVAEYREDKQKPYKVFINQDTAKKLNLTFPGKPLFVDHVDEVDLDKIQEQADGYVVESFYNKNDGNHWAKFIVISDAGHEAIRKGWKLSNAYVMTSYKGSGTWHGVDYEREVTDGKYDHLAIVPNPRYAESVILTPEEFEMYNARKGEEMGTRFINSDDKKQKGDQTMSVLNFFKRQKVENSAEFETTAVILPKSQREKTIAQLVNEADDAEMKKDEKQMANGAAFVNIAGTDITVDDMIKKYNEMCAYKMNADAEKMKAEEDKKKANVTDKDGGELGSESKEDKAINMTDEQKAAKALADKEEAENKKKNSHFFKLRNAHLSPTSDGKKQVIETSGDKVARGQQRYGSGK